MLTPYGEEVEVPKLRTKVSDKLIDLNIRTIRSDLAKVAIDMDFVEDLSAISLEDADVIEDVIREGFESRVRAKYSEASKVIGDDEIKSLSNAYMQTLRKVKTLHKVKFEQDQIMYRLKGLEDAIPRALIDPAVTPEALIDSTAAAAAGDPVGITAALDDLARGVSSGATEPAVYGIDEVLDRAAKSIIELEGLAESAAAMGSPAAPRFTRAGDMFRRFLSGSGESLGALFSANKNKFVAGAAAAGLGVFALKSRKDVTQEGVSGPPLLPGGNPYESLPKNVSELSQSLTAPRGSGTSYNVSINASQDQAEEFMSRAGYLSKGEMQGTMHDSLPNLGGNSYDDIAGSF